MKFKVWLESNQQISFVTALQGNPYDQQTFLIFADWLEGEGDPDQELLRDYIANLKNRYQWLTKNSTPRFLAMCNRLGLRDIIYVVDEQIVRGCLRGRYHEIEIIDVDSTLPNVVVDLRYELPIAGFGVVTYWANLEIDRKACQVSSTKVTGHDNGEDAYEDDNQFHNVPETFNKPVEDQVTERINEALSNFAHLRQQA